MTLSVASNVDTTSDVGCPGDVDVLGERPEEEFDLGEYIDEAIEPLQHLVPHGGSRLNDLRIG